MMRMYTITRWNVYKLSYKCFFFFILLLSHQWVYSNEKSFLLSGEVVDIRIAPDDISFYTWSVYFDVKLNHSLSEQGFAEELNIDTNLVSKMDQAHPNKIHKFGRNGLYSEKDAKKFARKVKMNQPSCFEIKVPALLRYLKNQTFKLSIESLVDLKDCSH